MRRHPATEGISRVNFDVHLLRERTCSRVNVKVSAADVQLEFQQTMRPGPSGAHQQTLRACGGVTSQSGHATCTPCDPERAADDNHSQDGRHEGLRHHMRAIPPARPHWAQCSHSGMDGVSAPVLDLTPGDAVGVSANRRPIAATALRPTDLPPHVTDGRAISSRDREPVIVSGR